MCVKYSSKLLCTTNVRKMFTVDIRHTIIHRVTRGKRKNLDLFGVVAVCCCPITVKMGER